MDFTVDCATWRYGGLRRSADGPTCLLNEQDLSCCLGHCAQNMGLERCELIGMSEPSQLGAVNADYPLTDEAAQYLEMFAYQSGADEGCWHNNELSQQAMLINDREKLALTERINGLQDLFKRHGHTVKFVNVPEDEVRPLP